jgi:HAD superfamily hydrolase (TIGR01509 family)
MTDALNAVLAVARSVLLDFDGPVASLLPPGPNSELPDATRLPLKRMGIDLPEPIANTTDHLSVLRFAATQAPAVLDAVDRIAIAGEINAARLATPTHGADGLLSACRQSGRVVVIVSNNAAVAIEEYLERYGLTDQVSAVFGRPSGRPDLMKPNPMLVHQAIQALDEDPGNCVMIGDSTTDIEVSRATGVRSIGYAKTPKRGVELAAAGADALTDDMAALAAAARRIAVPG